MVKYLYGSYKFLAKPALPVVDCTTMSINKDSIAHNYRK